MSKKRPNPEQQTQDRKTAAAVALILDPLVARYPAQLTAVSALLNAFVNSKVEQPVKRKASTKLAPATAADTAHHSV